MYTLRPTRQHFQVIVTSATAAPSAATASELAYLPVRLVASVPVRRMVRVPVVPGLRASISPTDAVLTFNVTPALLRVSTVTFKVGDPLTPDFQPLFGTRQQVCVYLDGSDVRDGSVL